MFMKLKLKIVENKSHLILMWVVFIPQKYTEVRSSHHCAKGVSSDISLLPNRLITISWKLLLTALHLYAINKNDAVQHISITKSTSFRSRNSLCKPILQHKIAVYRIIWYSYRKKIDFTQQQQQQHNYDHQFL